MISVKLFLYFWTQFYRHGSNKAQEKTIKQQNKKVSILGNNYLKEKSSQKKLIKN